MKQVLQNLKSGETYIEEIPAPQLSDNFIQIQTFSSLISTGTEKMLVDFGRAGVIGKIRKQPEKVKMVLDKIRTDGLVATYESVQSKLNQPIPLGYCNVGRVISKSNAHQFKLNDRVVSNSYHAEIVRAAPNLCCKIPDNVSDEDACFAVIGAIALQGVRLTKPTLGETFVVMGLGLIGLLTVQLLKASGCHVIALDFDLEKLDQARKYGAIPVCIKENSDIVAAVKNANQGSECDGVLMTLSTDKDGPIHNAAQMCRKKGRIVLVGVTGLNLLRSDFYEKEITFQVSCSYGPGRYDPNYEEKAQDYPKDFVRWTAQRNMKAFLDMLALGSVNVSDLISHKFSIELATEAYELIAKNYSGFGIILTYPIDNITVKNTQHIKYQTLPFTSQTIELGVIGAGNYAQRVLLPCFKKKQINLQGICSSGGLTSGIAARKFNFGFGTSVAEDIINSDKINTVVIATNHDTHASYALKCLQKNKHVFVEKPLALTINDINLIEDFYIRNTSIALPILTVGYNRRFSPFIQEMKRVMDKENEAKFLILTINAGHIPPNHWTQNSHIGGGRIIGEACHFIDLARHLIGKKITSYKMSALPQSKITHSDSATIILSFEDGSQATIHYCSTGSKSFPKERVEVFCGGKTLQLDNYKKLINYGWKGTKNIWQLSQNKGQNECIKAFCDSITNKKNWPISLEEILEVAKITLEIGQVSD